jgi:hypothetical protein
LISLCWEWQMSSSEKPSTKIIVAVVSGLVLAALVYIFKNWVPAFFKWVWSVVGAGWGWTASSHSVPGSVLLLLSVAGLWCAAKILATARKPSPPAPPPEPHWTDFTEFEWEGVLWRWQYGSDGRMHTLVSFCVQAGCDMQTFAEAGRFFGAGSETTIYPCDRCRRRPEIEGSRNQIESRVIREIQRLLRGDGWKRHLRNPYV